MTNGKQGNNRKHRGIAGKTPGDDTPYGQIIPVQDIQKQGVPRRPKNRLPQMILSPGGKGFKRITPHYAFFFPFRNYFLEGAM
ncbi:MAG: hypothetical protein JETT_3445 [Candidatus Jettenia ecosi]|uniref:Uncharacterized protein n=1 Tax=Candidatus Jettenia ecosi TaxID=2494326 RepID=A0A533QIB0_9BACT|nr:MAG: hypothetical protein JETT_3445 [Candidatus Jettenia ecosi]